MSLVSPVLRCAVAIIAYFCQSLSRSQSLAPSVRPPVLRAAQRRVVSPRHNSRTTVSVMSRLGLTVLLTGERMDRTDVTLTTNVVILKLSSSH